MILHYMVTVPDDAVVMMLLCWIKPEIEFFFSSSTDTSICIHISLKYPNISLIMTQKFNINLIMVVWICICIRHLRKKISHNHSIEDN